MSDRCIRRELVEVSGFIDGSGLSCYGVDEVEVDILGGDSLV